MKELKRSLIREITGREPSWIRADTAIPARSW
jgi:hypothetical protein